MSWHQEIPEEYRDAVVTGDALSLMMRLPDGCVDAVITDPPYSSGGAFRGDRMADTSTKYVVEKGIRPVRFEFMGDNRDQRSYHHWCALWLAECLRVSRAGAVCLLFTDWRQLPTTTDALQAGGWVWRGIAPWNKSEAARPDKARFRNQCEYVVWGTAGPVDVEANPVCLPGFFQHVVRSAEKEHIAGKPLGLMSELVRIVRPGGVVLDPFCGSATTCLAAAQSGRHYIGFELDNATVDRARQRLRDVTPPLLQDTEQEADPATLFD